jgi:2,3-bisphosphoglycerate-independent phosphoglycerate mutase
LERKITDYLPKGQNSELLLSMMKRSRELLKDHPVNKSRIERGLNPVSSLWFWGEGRKPNLTAFEEKYGKKGAVVSAVDLIKGIGICAGLNSIDVEGATGNIDTNFDGKAQAAIDALLSGDDFVYVHMEAPDECGHRFEPENKVKAIELIDEKVLKPMMEAMEKSGEDYAVLLMPDHPTPLELRTHTSDPVPFVIYRSNAETDNGPARYTEAEAAATGVYFDHGYELMGELMR